MTQQKEKRIGIILKTKEDWEDWVNFQLTAKRRGFPSASGFLRALIKIENDRLKAEEA